MSAKHNVTQNVTQNESATSTNQLLPDQQGRESETVPFFCTPESLSTPNPVGLN